MLTVVSDDALIGLHQSKSFSGLARALFRLVNEAVPNHLQVLIFQPEGGTPQSFCSIPELLPVYEKYLTHSDTELWFNEGPESYPGVKEKGLHRSSRQSRFHKEFMRPVFAEHAVSLVAWKDDNWTGCLTILRTKDQSDFTPREEQILTTCRAHFQAAVDRLMLPDAGQNCLRTLERFIWSIPTAAIVLDWNLKPLYFNASAIDLACYWKTGDRFAKTKKSKSIPLDEDLLKAIEISKLDLFNLRKNANSWHGVIPIFEQAHPTLPDLRAKFAYCPGETDSFNDGTFLLSFTNQKQAVDEHQTYERFCQLSPREREVVLLAAQGLDSGEISKTLGTAGITVRSQLHSAYKKLGISSRYELVVMFSSHSLLVDKNKEAVNLS